MIDRVRDDLFAFINALRQVNAGCRIILTVSPVPLIATYANAHVRCSTTYSKSVLRVAAEEASERFPSVAYFPSYEIIVGHYNKGAYFEPDLRSVTAAGVDHVMRCFFRNFTVDDALRSAPPRVSKSSALRRSTRNSSGPRSRPAR